MGGEGCGVERGGERKKGVRGSEEGEGSGGRAGGRGRRGGRGVWGEGGERERGAEPALGTRALPLSAQQLTSHQGSRGRVLDPLSQSGDPQIPG